MAPIGAVITANLRFVSVLSSMIYSNVVECECCLYTRPDVRMAQPVEIFPRITSEVAMQEDSGVTGGDDVD